MGEEGKKLTITVASDAGDTETIELNENVLMRQLLIRGVHKLYGEGENQTEYEVLIDGSAVEDLTVSLKDAGLQDGSTVVVQKIDVSRG